MKRVSIEGFFDRDASNVRDMPRREVRSQPPQPAAEPLRGSTVTGRGFLVAIDGSTVCRNCSAKGSIPHHLSLIFWQFWTRAQIAALIAAMQDDERLNWIAKGLVRVDGPNGVRELREIDGFWVEVATDELTIG